MMSQVDCKQQQRFDVTFLICCLVLILFSSGFFRLLHEILSVLQSQEKIFWYQLYTNLAYVPPTYKRVKNYEL